MHRRDLRVELREQRLAARIGVGIQLVGPLVERDQPLADAALASCPAPSGSRRSARAISATCAEAELVDLVAGHRHRRRGFGGRGVIGVAVGQAARRRRRASPWRAVRSPARAGGRARGRPRSRTIARPLRGAFGRQVRRLQLGGQRRRPSTVVVRPAGRAAPPAASAWCRGYSRARTRPWRHRRAAARFRRRSRRESLEAREIGVGVGRLRDAVLRVEEVGDVAIGAGQLAQDIGRVAGPRLSRK